MKKALWGVLCACFAGTASAGELDYTSTSNDYAAKLFYRVDFGGTADTTQSVGLRFDTARAEALGAPAFLQARFNGRGTSVMLSGLDLNDMAMAARATGDPTYGGLTLAQWVGIGSVVVVGGAMAITISNDNPPEAPSAPSGSGTGA